MDEIAEAGEQIDVAIVTAIKLEYDALLKVDAGALPGSTWERRPGPTGFEIAVRAFHTVDGDTLRFVATYALEMGGVATANAAAPLLLNYKPRCLAMCGVCAGRRGDVRLGDVIIGDRLWTYDTGAIVVEKDAAGRDVERLKADQFQYNLHAIWKHRAESFQPIASETWLAERPRPYDAQGDWLMSRLLAGEEHPGNNAERSVLCADFPKVVTALRKRSWLEPHGLRLSETGRAYIEDRVLLHPEGLPEPEEFAIHVGPIGTGVKVVRDPQIFNKLSERMRKVIGLEMEAAAIGAIAHHHDVDRVVVMKGVMDYADPEKNDNFKEFAARASAECLVAFLRQNLPAYSKGEKAVAKASSRLPPSAELKEKKKQACTASHNHNVEEALRLWEEVRKQADKEGNRVEDLGAKLETVKVLAQDARNPTEAFELAEACLRDASLIDLREDQCHLFQLLAEVHRLKGNSDQARGFIVKALEHAKTSGSKADEGFALLSLSMLERSQKRNGENTKALEFLGLAYDAFSALYAAGDDGKQKSAKEGFAQCHALRAEIYDYIRPDDALAEWARSLQFFQDLGAEWEWDVADTLLRRADLRGRLGEHPLAATDLNNAEQIFLRIADTVGAAKCYLQAGELLDAMGKRDTAEEPYHRAAAIAATWNNDRRASYFYFRHACKLVELNKYDEAEAIFVFLANGEWLEKEHRFTVLSQLCLIARAAQKPEELRERCGVALTLLDDLIQKATSAEKRRSLLIQRGSLFEQLGQHDNAIECFKTAIARFEAINDRAGVIECWFSIRGVWQTLGDAKQEREASEAVLALGAEETSPMLAALTLVGLAQLNLGEQRFVQARRQLDRAEELAPENPAVVMIAADLRSKLPQFSSSSMSDGEFGQLAQRDLPALIRELHAWCNRYPKFRKAILVVWYYMHRTDLWAAFRSMLGVKFLICAIDREKFASVKNDLDGQGDLFVWCTNFALNIESKSVMVPAPGNLIYPAGTRVIARSDNADAQDTPTAKSKVFSGTSLLTRVGIPKQKFDEPYYLAYVKGMSGFQDVHPFFVGRRGRLDEKIVRFMLGPSCEDLIASKSICLPGTEGKAVPSLTRTMQVAWENGAVPFYIGDLPHSDKISAVCATNLNLPTQPEIPNAAKNAWLKLLSSCAGTPQLSLSTFKDEIASFVDAEAEGKLPVRVYLLRFQAGEEEVTHPAVVIGSGSARAGRSKRRAKYAD